MNKPDIVEHYEEMTAAGGSVYFDPVELSDVFHYYMENGTHEQLSAVMTLSKELHPDDETVRLMDVEYMLNAGDAAGALALLDTMFDETLPYHCILRSAALAKLGRQAEAMEMARLASMDEEQDEYISYDLGLGFMNAEEYTTALNFYHRSLEHHPDDVRTLSGILYCKTQTGDNAGLEELADKIIQLDPFHYEAWLAKGNVKAMEKKYVEAYDAFDYAIAISPDDVDAYVYKARVKDEEGHRDEAMELLDEAEGRAEGEQCANIWVMKAYLFFSGEKKEEARNAVWKSLEYVQLTPSVCFRAACCFNDVGALTDEVAMLRAAEKDEPDRAEVLTMLGEAYNELGMYEEASDVYRRIAELTPSPMIYALWGSCQLSLGNFAEAYRLFGKSNKEEPLWQSYILMTTCDIEMSQFKRMEEDFRMAYALNPDGAVELLEKIAPDMVKQMRENGFLKRIEQQREKDIRRREMKLLALAEEKRLKNEPKREKDE